MLEKTAFRKLDLLPSSGEGTETSTQLSHLEGANLNYWTPHLKTETCGFRNFLVSTQNYRVSGLSPSCRILNTRKHDVSETGSVSILR
jgi:hypothetical protein